MQSKLCVSTIQDWPGDQAFFDMQNYICNNSTWNYKDKHSYHEPQ